MDLPFDDHRVDPRAAIVQRVEAADFRHTRVDIDIHDADISAEGIGHVGRVVIADRLEPRFDPRNGLIVSGIGNFLHRLEPLGRALDDKPVDVPFDIVIMHFEQVRRDHLRLGADLAPGHRCCGTGHRGRA